MFISRFITKLDNLKNKVINVLIQLVGKCCIYQICFLLILRDIYLILFKIFHRRSKTYKSQNCFYFFLKSSEIDYMQLRKQIHQDQKKCEITQQRNYKTSHEQQKYWFYMSKLVLYLSLIFLCPHKTVQQIIFSTFLAIISTRKSIKKDHFSYSIILSWELNCWIF